MTVIPDSIEPVVGWRGWRLSGDALASCHYGGAWDPGTELTARCLKTSRDKSWQPESIEAAIESGLPMSVDWAAADRDDDGYLSVPAPPRIALPYDMAYVWRESLHSAPDTNCVCGIYAAASPEGCISYPISVLGRVALWGNVVPGDKGWRAEHAYPLELFVLERQPTVKENAGIFFASMMLWSPAITKESFPPAADVEYRLAERYGVPTQRVQEWTELSRVAA